MRHLETASKQNKRFEKVLCAASALGYYSEHRKRRLASKTNRLRILIAINKRYERFIHVTQALATYQALADSAIMPGQNAATANRRRQRAISRRR